MVTAAATDVVAALLRSYLFEDLDPEAVRPLALTCSVRHLVRGEFLCHVGDVVNEIYVVITGEVKDILVSVDGEEVIHFVHGPGMTLGEAGFFSVDRVRIVDVVAVAPTTILRLDRRDLVPFMTRHPQVKDRALEGLASNTRWQTTMIAALATRPLVNRLAFRLLELVDSNTDRTNSDRTNSDRTDTDRRNGIAARTPKISQTTLAAMIGATRENVNRALAVLTEQGYVRREAGAYLLLDEAGLRRELAQDWPQVDRRDRRL
jgi:CRP/FNR family cyclic AMP-dependent transcriptional regulator